MAVSHIGHFPAPEISITTAKLKEKLKVKHAIECVLSPCVKTYDISVCNGVPSIQTSSPEFGEIFYPENDRLHTELHTELLKACWKPERGGLVNVSLNEEDWPPESKLWENAKFAGCPVSLDPSHWLTTNHTWSQFYNKTDKTWGAWSAHGAKPILHCANGSNFADMMSNVAASMTKYARDISNQTVQGVANVPQVYVSVNWAYMILPGLLILLGVIFFLLTISVNRKHELNLWKSSILPAIFHGIPEGIVDHEYATASAMERTAREASVQLEASNPERRLLLRNDAGIQTT